MRYLLVLTGLIAVAIGWLGSSHSTAVVWYQIGAVFVAVGLATCEIVAAISRSSKGVNHAQQLDRFRDATRTGDSATMANLLKSGGIPEDVANRTANDVLQNSESLKL